MCENKSLKKDKGISFDVLKNNGINNCYKKVKLYKIKVIHNFTISDSTVW